jgi:hypothetical protein
MKKPILDEFDRHCIREGCSYGKRLKAALELARFKRELDRFFKPKIEKLLNILMTNK